MIQSDITGICQAKAKRTGATDLANLKLSLNRMLEWLSLYHLANPGMPPFECLKTSADLSIVEGEYYKDLPSGFVDLTADPTLIDGSAESRMTKRDRDYFSDVYPYQAHASASKSVPVDFYIENQDFIFNKSNSAYTIRVPYSRLHAALTDDTSTIYFPNQFKMLLAYLTLWDFFDDLDNEEKSAKYWKLAEIELAKLGLLEYKLQSRSRNTAYSDL